MARTTPESARGLVAWLSPGIMILVGVILFFIPAPPTSIIGIALILAGAVLWLVDYFGRDRRSGTSEGGTELGGEVAEAGRET